MRGEEENMQIRDFKMKSENQITEVIKVPQDMLIEILAILLKENIKLEIARVLENKAIAEIAIFFDLKESRNESVLKNINQLLTAYNEYRHSEDDSIEWRDN